MEAIAGVFAESFDSSSKYCSLMVRGVKSNIGHIEPTAQIAGLIKAIFVLGQEYFISNVDLKKLNTRFMERIEIYNLPVELPNVV